MRLIGNIDTESQARVFRSYLLTLGMHSDVEQSRDKRWGIWVHEETRLDEGKRELEQFLADPKNDRYQAGARTGEVIEKQVQREEKKFKERHVDLRTAWHKSQMAGGPLTLTLMFLCIGVYVLQQVPGTGNLIQQWLLIMGLENWMNQKPLLIEVMHGQVWRLITPIFLHFGILHVLFNVMWLRTLGGDIERVEGTGILAIQVVTYAVISNVLQLYFATPLFGGMSGVNYGLFAYVWLMGKYTHEARYQLDPMTIGLMLFWFVACWLGWIGSVANWAHTGGLVMGAVWATVKLRRVPFTSVRF